MTSSLLRFAACIALLALSALPASAEEKRAATVSILEGTARHAGADGKPQPLAKGDQVLENAIVETDAGARVELTLSDKSVIRIGPSSKLQLKSAYFGNAGEKKVSAKLFFGRVWSKVSSLVGGESKFEVETDNAVAGVRGTTFRVDAKSDKSVLVRVYAGAVAMAPGAAIPKAGGRKQIQGPKQVTRDQWEKIVGKMMQLAVNADGQPVGEPTAFTPADDAGDEWAAWNSALDADVK